MKARGGSREGGGLGAMPGGSTVATPSHCKPRESQGEAETPGTRLASVFPSFSRYDGKVIKSSFSEPKPSDRVPSRLGLPPTVVIQTNFSPFSRTRVQRLGHGRFSFSPSPPLMSPATDPSRSARSPTPASVPTGRRAPGSLVEGGRGLA